MNSDDARLQTCVGNGDSEVIRLREVAHKVNEGRGHLCRVVCRYWCYRLTTKLDLVAGLFGPRGAQHFACALGRRLKSAARRVCGAIFLENQGDVLRQGVASSLRRLNRVQYAGFVVLIQPSQSSLPAPPPPAPVRSHAQNPLRSPSFLAFSLLRSPLAD